jgi:hypothetical protein
MSESVAGSWRSPRRNIAMHLAAVVTEGSSGDRTQRFVKSGDIANIVIPGHALSWKTTDFDGTAAVGLIAGGCRMADGGRCNGAGGGGDWAGADAGTASDSE